MSASRPTGVYRVRLKKKENAPPDGIAIVEWQSYAGYVVYFGSEEYGTENDIAEWYEMISRARDWSD